MRPVKLGSQAEIEDVANRLLSGESTVVVANDLEVSPSKIWTVAVEHGLVYDNTSKRWIQTRSYTPSVKRDARSDLPSAEIIDGVVQSLLAGNGRRVTANRFNLTDNVVRGIAKRAGLIWDGRPTRGNWIRQEETTVNDDTWNMSTDDYEALLTPERERTNENGSAATDMAAREAADRLAARSSGDEHFDSYDTDVAAVASRSSDLGSIKDDINEARDLLAQAERQRKDDLATIQEYKTANRKIVTDQEAIQLHSHELRKTIRDLETKVLQLETETKRLMGELKKEIGRSATLEEKINRGLLRQSMDSLRKVL